MTQGFAPQIIDVLWLGEDRAAIKAGVGDGIAYRLVDRAEGERIAVQLATDLRERP